MGAIFRNILRPALFGLPAETAHDLSIRALRLGLGTEAARNAASRAFSHRFKFGPIERFGLTFENPLGIAAGFDKNALVVDQLGALGFGFVEVGTVTLKPQPGNPKPRLFRLPEDLAIINRFGFNNDGASAVSDRLRSIDRKIIVGVNIGKNKDVDLRDAVANYRETFRLVYPVADYLVVNVSSPNTPNLRELQATENLNELLGELQALNAHLGNQKLKPMLVKIAPDLADGDIESIAGLAIEHRLAGVIATNTTVAREGLSSRINETGGLSGAPLRARSTEIIRRLYRAAAGKFVIIGVGGIFTADDAFEKIAAGAGLIQAYTGFVYGGPNFARDVLRGLEAILEREGISAFDDAVGCRAR